MGLATNVLQQLAAGNTSLEGLAGATGAGKKEIVKSVQVLKGRGLVVTHVVMAGEVSGPAPGIYILTDAGQQFAASGQAISPGQGERPRKKTVGLRERAWWHFRAHKVSSLKELLGTHAEGGEKAAHINLYKYLMALERAGILQRLPQRIKARQSKWLVQWRLALDLGTMAPVWRQVARTVYDPNDGRVFSLAGDGSHE